MHVFKYSLQRLIFPILQGQKYYVTQSNGRVLLHVYVYFPYEHIPLTSLHL